TPFSRRSPRRCVRSDTASVPFVAAPAVNSAAPGDSSNAAVPRSPPAVAATAVTKRDARRPLSFSPSRRLDVLSLQRTCPFGLPPPYQSLTSKLFTLLPFCSAEDPRDLTADTPPAPRRLPPTPPPSSLAAILTSALCPLPTIPSAAAGFLARLH
uniref:Uncharacterized protein n=1 Tax=Aegilops tauschii subsp. strangulata TaxID=200361 RepID=A0A453F134_AEGTS